MPNYHNTKIYKIQVGEELYYGMTTISLEQRRYVHVHDAKKSNTKLYKAMREANMTANDIQLILVENYPCKDRKEAGAREKYWIQKFGSLNMATGHSYDSNYQKDYRIKNKDRMKQLQLEYYAKNKETIKAYSKQYRQQNLAQVTVYAKDYRQRKSNFPNKPKDTPL